MIATRTFLQHRKRWKLLELLFRSCLTNGHLKNYKVLNRSKEDCKNLTFFTNRCLWWICSLRNSSQNICTEVFHSRFLSSSSSSFSHQLNQAHQYQGRKSMRDQKIAIKQGWPKMPLSCCLFWPVYGWYAARECD